MRYVRWFLSSFLIFVISGSLASAGEIVFPAGQLEKGTGAVCLFFTQSAEKLSFRVNSRDVITVGGNSYFSEVSNDLESDATRKTVGAKVIFNPWDGLTYWFGLGTGSFDVEIPSATVKNRLSSKDNGITASIGFRSRIFPETIVSPAIALDFGAWYSRYDMVQFVSGNSVNRVADVLEETQLQGSLLVSKRFRTIEPYGGLKIFGNLSSLRDTAGSGEVSGTRDGAGIIAGARLRAYPHESLVVEASFTGTTDFTLGWNIDF